MTERNKQIIIKSLKVAAVAVLFAVSAYLLYGAIGSLVLWTMQPKFISAASVTSSAGFLVQMCVYFALLLLSLAAAIFLTVLFFKKKKEKHFKHDNGTKWV